MFYLVLAVNVSGFLKKNRRKYGKYGYIVAIHKYFRIWCKSVENQIERSKRKVLASLNIARILCVPLTSELVYLHLTVGESEGPVVIWSFRTVFLFSSRSNYRS